MKLAINALALQHHVNRLARIVPHNSTMPVLKTLLLTATPAGLAITANNLEYAARLQANARIEEPGALCVPAKKFIDVVNELPDNLVTLSTTDTLLKLHCGSINATFSTMEGDEFPAIAESHVADERAVVSTASLKKALARVVFAASSDEYHPVLTGVLWEFSEKLTLATADGFRLAMDVLATEYQPAARKDIVPAKACGELIRLLEDVGEVSITFARNNSLRFEFDGGIFSAQLIDGNYPDVRRIIPPAVKIKATVVRAELLAAVKLASIFAKDKANIVTVQLDSNGLTVTADGDDGKGKQRITAQVDGTEEYSIAVNYTFLVDVLGVLGCEDVVLGFNKPTQPITLAGVGVDSFTHVMMPMHLGGR